MHANTDLVQKISWTSLYIFMCKYRVCLHFPWLPWNSIVWLYPLSGSLVISKVLLWKQCWLCILGNYLQIKTQKWIWWYKEWVLVQGFCHMLPHLQQKGLLVGLPLLDDDKIHIMYLILYIYSTPSISTEDSMSLVLGERDTNRFQSSGQHLAFREAAGMSCHNIE